MFLNAVLWIVQTGAPWRDLPPDYGDWKNTHRRFCRCREGVSGNNSSLIDEPDMEWLMVDATYVKVHPHAVGAVGSNQGMGRTKGGLNTKAHLAVDAHGLPLGVTVTEGAVADCKEFGNLLDEVDQKSEHVIADKNYDSDELINDVEERGAKPFIPPNQTEKIRGHTISIYIRLGSWSKMLF